MRWVDSKFCFNIIQLLSNLGRRGAIHIFHKELLYKEPTSRRQKVELELGQRKPLKRFSYSNRPTFVIASKGLCGSQL